MMTLLAQLLFWCSSLHAKVAYLGVADVGTARGVLGHVFVVFADEPGRIADATAYQFALEVPERTPLDLGSVPQLRRFPFRFERRSAWAFIRSYTDEDRAVTLYRLNLDEIAVDELEAQAEREHRRRREQTIYDFSLDRNCATRALDLINRIAPEGRTLDYFPPTQLANPLRLTHVNAALLSIPAASLPRLSRHPLVKERLRFRPRHLVELQAAVVALAELRPLLAACKVSPNAREMLARAFARPRLRHSREYVDAFGDLVGPCARELGLGALYDAHLDFVLFDAEDPDFVGYVNAVRLPQ